MPLLSSRETRNRMELEVANTLLELRDSPPHKKKSGKTLGNNNDKNMNLRRSERLKIKRLSTPIKPPIEIVQEKKTKKPKMITTITKKFKALKINGDKKMPELVDDAPIKEITSPLIDKNNQDKQPENTIMMEIENEDDDSLSDVTTIMNENNKENDDDFEDNNDNDDAELTILLSKRKYIHIWDELRGTFNMNNLLFMNHLIKLGINFINGNYIVLKTQNPEYKLTLNDTNNIIFTETSINPDYNYFKRSLQCIKDYKKSTINNSYLFKKVTVTKSKNGLELKLLFNTARTYENEWLNLVGYLKKNNLLMKHLLKLAITFRRGYFLLPNKNSVDYIHFKNAKYNDLIYLKNRKPELINIDDEDE